MAHLPDILPSESPRPEPHPGEQPLAWGWPVALAVLGVVAMQLIQHFAFMPLMGRSMFAYHAVAALLNAIVVFAVVAFYLGWKRAAARTAAALEALQVSETLREDMTSMLVHDLKNPLAAVSGSTQVVMEMERSHEGGPDPVRMQMLSLSLDGQKRLARMIDSVLEIARAQGGHMLLEAGPVDVIRIVEEAVAEAATTAALSGVEIGTQFPQHPVVITGDNARLRRTLDNLIANSLKYTPAGGRVTVTVACLPDEIQVTVADTGQGVPVHMRERIFDRFTQGADAIHGHRVSVGLGLAFCKLAVEAHGGRIWVDSPPSGGSAFTFALPSGSTSSTSGLSLPPS